MSPLFKGRRATLYFYMCFSYCSRLIWGVLDLVPGFVRTLVFRLAFKRFGRGGMLDYQCFVRYPWRMSIGHNVDINRRCEFYPSMKTAEGEITLEDHVVLGPGVTIFASTHDYGMLDLPDKSAPVRICRYAWVGGRSIILPGVIIGEGAVIGAGAVVTRDIPPYSVAVGNPARVIKKRMIKNV